VTGRNNQAITLTVNATTVIQLDDKKVTLADLKTDEAVVVEYDRNTKVATRIQAASPPPISLDGTITALDAAAGTLQVTTDHGTAVTLSVNTDTRVRLNNSATTFETW